MRILYVGDIMGRPGRKVVRKFLPSIVIQNNIDIVIAQAENVTHGKGMSTSHYVELLESGIHGFTGGNHSFERKDTLGLALNTESSVVVPANHAGDTFGNHKIVVVGKHRVAIVSLLGFTFPGGYGEDVINPLRVIDDIMSKLEKEKPTAIVVNIHSDFSSEKVIMGHYLDGRVSAVIGDHWHVPTADARLLPKGTAHVTDVGMCGALNSSLGVEIEIATNKWKGQKLRNRLDEGRELQFNAVLVEVDESSMKTVGIERVQRYFP